MIPDEPTPDAINFIPTAGTVARLHIDDIDVGSIIVSGCDSTWTHGTFSPGAAFSRFAPIFGQWSLLMHDDEDRPLHPTASTALADAERQMDALHVKLHFPDLDVWQIVRQLNIDGKTAEWKVT